MEFSEKSESEYSFFDLSGKSNDGYKGKYLLLQSFIFTISLWLLTPVINTSIIVAMILTGYSFHVNFKSEIMTKRISQGIFIGLIFLPILSFTSLYVTLALVSLIQSALLTIIIIKRDN